MAISVHPSTVLGIAIPRSSLETLMHPFGIYLAVTDHQRELGNWTGGRPGVSFARVDAPPLVEAPRASRIWRLTAIVRRRVLRATGA